VTDRASTLDLSEADEVGAREDALADEVRAAAIGLVAPVWDADCLDRREATWPQALVNGSKVARQELVAHSLDHLDAHDLREVARTERRGGIPVVAQDNADAVRHARLGHAGLCQLELLRGEGDPDPALQAGAALHGTDGHAAPTAADLQHGVPVLEADGVHDTVKLLPLRHLQEVLARVRPLLLQSVHLLVENACGVGHVLAEEHLEHGVGQVVVRLNVALGACVCVGAASM